MTKKARTTTIPTLLLVTTLLLSPPTLAAWSWKLSPKDSFNDCRSELKQDLQSITQIQTDLNGQELLQLVGHLKTSVMATCLDAVKQLSFLNGLSCSEDLNQVQNLLGTTLPNEHSIYFSAKAVKFVKHLKENLGTSLSDCDASQVVSALQGATGAD